MICPRHGTLTDRAPYGYPMCDRCFREAVIKAEDRMLEEKMAELYALRLNSVDALMQRLGWRK